MMQGKILILLLVIAVSTGEAPAELLGEEQKARCFVEWSDPTRRVQACTTLVDDPNASVSDRFAAYVGRARAFYASAEWARSIEDFDVAIRLRPDDGDLYNERGAAFDRKGDRELSVADFSHAIRLNPENATAYSNRGLANYKSGLFDLARADFDAAIGLNPRSAVAYNGRGMIFGLNGDHKRAIADFTAAIRLDDNYANAYNNRGIANANAGAVEQAIADLKEAIRLDSSNPDFYNELAWTFVRAGNPIAGLPYAERALELNPDHANALDTRGAIREAFGEIEKALTDYRRALSVNPGLSRSADAIARLERVSADGTSLSEVIRFVKERGWLANFDDLCGEFELSDKSDKCFFRQISVQEAEGRGDARGFNVPAVHGASPSYIVIFHLRPLVGEFYIASPEGTLVRAYYRTRGAGYNRVRNNEVEQEFRADLSYWRTNLARLQRGLGSKDGGTK